ncbi:hypothetical protein BJV77DRAFT_558350 [Russula vinacea]|nr:hypothetical protein BJV77DRAFT_558350 [Russula vinacea]
MPHSRARPVAPPVHLGAFVHPFGPLPLPRNRTVARATLYIPALALPRARPAHPRVWGSGPYTDDSDIISAAVHAGRVRWSDVSEASRRGQDARVEVQVVPAAERYFGSVGSAPEPGSGGEPDDDGRGFFSAGWGNGHEGAGIEILDVAFVKGGTAHRAPGLGRQNRKQRLGEYAAERGAVLGFAASAAASGAVGGRTKRARGVGVGRSGVPDSDETDEDGMGTESEIEEEEDEEDMDVDALAARVTIRVDDEDAMEGEEPTKANTNGSLLPLRRGVELETAVERFLLRMNDAGAELDTAVTDGITAASGDVIDEGEDKKLLQGGRANDGRRWEIWLLGTLDGDDDAEKDGNRLPPLPGGSAVLLQQGLRAENLEFVEGEVRVLQDAPAPAGGDMETSTGAREGWAIEVRRWRWARW